MKRKLAYLLISVIILSSLFFSCSEHYYIDGIVMKIESFQSTFGSNPKMVITFDNGGVFTFVGWPNGIIIGKRNRIFYTHRLGVNKWFDRAEVIEKGGLK